MIARKENHQDRIGREIRERVSLAGSRNSAARPPIRKVKLIGIRALASAVAQTRR
jgi:hypothetical protein